MGREWFALMATLAVSGCAGINVQALTPDGMSASGKPGMRYYMPRPYLLVTAVPVPQVQTQENANPEQKELELKGKAADPGAANNDNGKKTTTAQTDPQPATVTTDTSYQQSGNGYLVKLVYLPVDVPPLFSSRQNESFPAM